MVKQLLDLHTFAKRWKLPFSQVPAFDAGLVKTYQSFMAEELQHELSEAAALPTEREKLTHTTDCLIDGMVFILQLANALGLTNIMELAWDEVHRSNRTKGDQDTNTLADQTGKWIKGPGYSKPDLEQFFHNGMRISFLPHQAVTVTRVALAVQSAFPKATIEVLDNELTIQDRNLDSVGLVAFMVEEATKLGFELLATGQGEYDLKDTSQVAKLDAYQQWIKRVAQYPSGLVYTTLGLAAEAGEVSNVVLKVMRRLSTQQVKATDLGNKGRANLLDELGDLLFYLVATANELGITMEQLADGNRTKIEQRIKDGTVYATN